MTLSNDGITLHRLSDIVGPKPTAKDFAAVQAEIEQNFGVSVPADKILLLRREIEKAGWSRKRLRDALSWFLQHQKYPAWSIADFFAAPSVTLYPRSWYLEQIHNDRSAGKRIESYVIEGVSLYRYADGTTLPFELRTKARANGNTI